MLGCLFRRLGDDRKVQASADHAGDILEWNAFFCDGVIPASSSTMLKCKAVDAGGVEPVHSGPAVEPFAHIGRNTPVPGDAD
jgi:hypothetical protein